MEAIKDVCELLNNSDNLLVPFANIHPHITEIFDTCRNAICKTEATGAPMDSADSLLRRTEFVLIYLHDHLNLGQWDQVSTTKRQAYTAVSYVKCLMILQYSPLSNPEEKIKLALKVVDKGFLLGLPLANNLNLLTDCARVLSACLNSVPTVRIDEAPPSKKIKLDSSLANVINITKVRCPSLETFQKEYFLSELPVILQDCMTSWPAMTKWQDLRYLLNIAGERTVPIELGSSYSAENFSQKLMTLREFIETYYAPSQPVEIGYLAQHDLLTQIPQLVEDIIIPDYCCISRTANSSEDDDDDDVLQPEINAWLGPAGTVSSLHYDPKDNFLCQVYGAKQIVMFSPKDSPFLYPHEETMLTNTSKVNPLTPDLENHPEFKNVTMYGGILNAGEMLYIPPKWWHHITALEKSFSVNFWWK